MKIKILSLLLVGALIAPQAQAMLTRQVSERTLEAAEKTVTTMSVMRRVAAPLSALASGTTALVLGGVAFGCDACDDATKTGLRATAFCLSSISVMYAGYKLRQKCNTIRREAEYAARKKAEAEKLKHDAHIVRMTTKTEIEDEVTAEETAKQETFLKTAQVSQV